jgi:hypothetical protein
MAYARILIASLIVASLSGALFTISPFSLGFDAAAGGVIGLSVFVGVSLGYYFATSFEPQSNRRR